MAEDREVIVTSDGGGGGGAVLAVVGILALLVALFLFFGTDVFRGGTTDKIEADVKIDTPNN